MVKLHNSVHSYSCGALHAYNVLKVLYFKAMIFDLIPVKVYETSEVKDSMHFHLESAL